MPVVDSSCDDISLNSKDFHLDAPYYGEYISQLPRSYMYQIMPKDNKNIHGKHFEKKKNESPLHNLSKVHAGVIKRRHHVIEIVSTI